METVTGYCAIHRTRYIATVYVDRPSVTLRYRGHIGWNTSKAILWLTTSLQYVYSLQTTNHIHIYFYTVNVNNNRRVIGCRLKHVASRCFLATARLSCFCIITLTYAVVVEMTDAMERRFHVRIRGASPYGFKLAGGRGHPVSITKVNYN